MSGNSGISGDHGHNLSVRKIILFLLAAMVVVGLSATALVYWFFSGDGLRRAIEQQATAWLGQPVKVGRASAGIFPRTAIRLGDVRIGEPARVTLAEVNVSTDFRELLSRRIQDADVTISNSRIEMPLPFSIPADSESDTTTTPASNTTGRTVEIVSIRTISLENIVLVSRGKEVTVSANSSLAGDRLSLRQFAARSGTTTLDAEGEVDLAPSVDARMKVKANKLDVDELLALAHAFTSPPQQGTKAGRRPSAPVKIAAQVTAETAMAGGIDVRQFATDIDVNGDRVALSPLTFQLFGGRYQGSVNAQLGNALSLTIKSRLENLNVAQLAAFGGSPDTISGTLNGSGTFGGSGADIAAVLKSARGMGTVTIADGAIRRLNLIRTIVLFFGRPAPDTAEATDRFERIDASFTLANQTFRADPFSMRSRDVDVAGSVTLNVDTKALDGAADLSLSEELSKQAGTDFARLTREGNRIVLPAKVSGTIDAPGVTIDAAAAAKRGLRNEVQRRLKGILEGFGR
jgi:uncharacterized protein involved in outer membrane biogenesis